jgi:hypothetical protein
VYPQRLQNEKPFKEKCRSYSGQSSGNERSPEKMKPERHFVELDEQAVLKLPYRGPLSRRIYLILERDRMSETRELFIQRPDAFTTSLIAAINELKSRQISEIRYSCGFDGFVRIFLNEKGKLVAEYSCESTKSLNDLKDKLGISQ